MTSLFRDQAVALLARERLHEIRDQLRAKKAAAPARFSAIEARVLWLAEQACLVTNAAPPVPTDKFPRVFHTAPGETASKFFAMGALGTSLASFGPAAAPDQDWMQRLLRKGTRDERRERVDAGSARFALEVWRRTRAAIDASALTLNQKTAAQAQARAFYLGHLCHIASGVVTGPLLDDMTWHLPGPPVSAAALAAGVTRGTDGKLSREQVEAQIDLLLKTNLFQPSIQTAVDYLSWLPAGAEVPTELFQALADATRDVYLTGTTHKGWKDLEDAFPADAPTPTRDFFAGGYSVLRNMVAGLLGGPPAAAPANVRPEWGFWSWVGVLTPLIVPSLVTVPLIGALDKGRDIGESGGGSEKAWWQVMSLQYAGTGLVLWLYTVIASATSYQGFAQESWVALILSTVVLGFSIALCATLDKEDELDAGARWTLLGIPAGLELLTSVIYFLIIRGGDNRFNRLFAMMFLLHLFITGLTCAYLAINDVSKGLRDGGAAAFGWWALYGLVLAPLVFLGVPALILKATNPSPPAPPGPPAPPPAPPINPFIQAPRYARLFDDSTLVADPDAGAPTLAQHYFPAGDADAGVRRRRKLMTLTLTGGPTADLYVRSRGDRLELTWVATGAAAPAPGLVAPAAAIQIVELPRAPNRARVLANLLGLVRQPAGPLAGPGVLTVAVDVPDNEDHLLPEGVVLAVGFEDDLTRADAARRTAAEAWHQVVAAGLPIFHATKARVSVQLGARGDATAADEADGVAGANATGTIVQGATNDLVTGNGTQFVRELAAGDGIQVGANRAVIDEVVDDTNLRLSAPAPWLPPAGPGGAAFRRIADDRRFDKVGVGTIQTHGGSGVVPPPFVVTAPPLVVGTGTQFDQFIMTGDVIRVVTPQGPQDRRVMRVLSATQMQLDVEFSTAIDLGGAGSSYLRVGRHNTDGMRFFASPATDLQSGSSALDQAADLAALLCLGGVSHTMTDADRQPVAGPINRFPGPPIARVYQCFRNWNLDRRRVNEWKMLVAGGALSEKGGRPFTQPESTMITPAIEDAWNPVNVTGEATANQLGWVETLRRWMDAARRTGVDVLSDAPLRPGDPSNVQLSRALAYLLDLPEPRP